MKEILNIGLHEDRLRRRAESVYFNEDGKLPIGTQCLIEAMVAALHWHQALGLAAPQVDEELRIIVVDQARCWAQYVVTDNGDDLDLNQAARARVLIDPVIVERSSRLVTSREACLSIPGCELEIQRHMHVVVRALAPDRAPIRIEASGIFAACLQHEIDHLDGVLFIDRASRLKQEWFKKRLKKEREGRVTAAWQAQ